MEKERSFSFKLFVPPRVAPGPVSAVRPQEAIEGSSGFMQTLSKHIDNKSNIEFSKTKTFIPFSAVKTGAVKKIAVMSMPEEDDEEKTEKISQLYSKLYQEAEKIKRWKIKIDTEIGQKENKIQENKKTMENQRKAIQELQFGNESLSMKLEEQINENKELEDQNTATRNLCNILQEKFERTAEKMNMYESEREETHHLLLQYNEKIQGVILAFEGLRVQAETERIEMLKLKDGMQQFEDFRGNFQKEIMKKEEEVLMLQEKVNGKNEELRQIWHNFQQAKHNCDQLEESARKMHEELQDSNKHQAEQLEEAKQLCRQNEANVKLIEAALEEKEQKLSEKDCSLRDLNETKEQQTAQIEELQGTIQDLHASLVLEKQRGSVLEEAINKGLEEMEKKSSKLGVIEDQIEQKERQIKSLKDDLDLMKKSITVSEDKLKTEKIKREQLATELVDRNTEICRLKNAVQIISVERTHTEKALEQLQKELDIWKDTVQERERQLYETEEQLSVALGKEGVLLEEINELKEELKQQEKTNDELLSSFSKLQLEKENVTKQITIGDAEAKTLEKQLKESEEKKRKEIEKLEVENHQLREDLQSLTANIEKQGLETGKLLEEHEESLNAIKKKMEFKTKTQEELQQEIKNLISEIASESEKCSSFECKVNELKAEMRRAERHHEEDVSNLRKDIETRSAAETELCEKVEKYKLTAEVAEQHNQETDLKCQHKISEMVALMEKHKSQYDKVLEEKDAELDQRRKKEREINSEKKSLEQELSGMKSELSSLKQQLISEIKEKEKLELEVNAMKEQTEQLKAELKKKDILGKENKKIKDFLDSTDEIEMDPHGCSAHASTKTTPYQKSYKSTVLQTSNKAEKKETLRKTPSWMPSTKFQATPSIKTYTIRTPPEVGKSMERVKSTPVIDAAKRKRKVPLLLDMNSDSSENTDLLSMSREVNTFKSLYSSDSPSLRLSQEAQKKSPAVPKSPGSALKLAAVKRMREAGWTAVTNIDRKKKIKESEKMFA
ncbi:synaptonemal complex protein 1 isoform X2 [Amia ocellicauda]|uniref:synaptonemal complex protein 1 isoform X2 n=1 Tax=Amia ocellicauda TaxID=2972642 RepID=UPI0034640CDA